MTPLKTTRTMLVSALFRQFGSTIQFFLISNQAVLSIEAGYCQKSTSIWSSIAGYFFSKMKKTWK